MSKYQAPAFLVDLLHARSPSGAEFEAQKVFDTYVKPSADTLPTWNVRFVNANRSIVIVARSSTRSIWTLLSW